MDSLNEKLIVRKTNKRIQKYRDEWERVPELRAWVCRANDVYKAKCRYCNSTMKADVSVLKAHAKGQKHLNMLEPTTSDMQSATTQCLDFQTENLNLDEILDEDSFENPDIETLISKKIPVSSKLSRKMKQEKRLKNEIDLDNQLISVIAEKLNPGETNWYMAFGQYVAEQLKALSPNMAAICKKMISEAIFEADMGHLNKYSRIENDVPSHLRDSASQTDHFGYTIILETPNKGIDALDRVLQ